MSNVESAEQVKQRRIQVMGQELGEIFHTLSNELTWLHFRWAEYVALYGKSAKRVELMNRAAPFFFAILQDVAWHDVLLSIARFVDPAESMGKKDKANLSIRALSPLTADATLRAKVEDLVQKARVAAEFAVDWRMRRLAHRDLAVALNRHPQPLKSANRLKVKEALESLAAVLNEMNRHYFDSTTWFDISEGEPGGAITLLERLRDGVKAHEARLQRMRDSTFTDDDLEAREPLD